MVVFVTGGSGCGKSAFAESVAQQLNEGNSELCSQCGKECPAPALDHGGEDPSGQAAKTQLVYVATMPVLGEEDEKKVARHHKLRAGKGFQTLERPKGLTDIPDHGETVLIECMSTHTANMLYDPSLVQEDDEDGAKAIAAICEEIETLSAREGSTVFVSAEITADGTMYDAETEKYKRVLNAVNRFLMERADAAYEVVCGIPVSMKQK